MAAKTVLYITACLVVAALSQSFQTIYAQENQAKSLLFTVAVDGRTLVEYDVGVNTILPSVNISLPSKAGENLLIVNENKLLLDFTVLPNETVISVGTLGSSMVRISYFTQELTKKTGTQWVFNVNSPSSFIVKLPSEATIVDMSSVPNAITLSDSTYLMGFEKGIQEISYTIGVIGTKEYATIIVRDAEKTIQTLEASGVIVTKAKETLTQAKDRLERRAYFEAAQLARQARSTALETNSTAVEAKTLLKEADDSILKAQSDGRTSGLAEAKRLLTEAQRSYAAGDYKTGMLLAKKARDQAAVSRSEDFLGNSLLLFGGIGIGATLAIGLTAFVMRRRKKSRDVSPSLLEKRDIDAKAILAKHADLRPDDREAIEYIAAGGGEVFEGEIRDHFKLPKTSIWRMIKRLEREELIEVRKIRGQNVVRIREER